MSVVKLDILLVNVECAVVVVVVAAAAAVDVVVVAAVLQDIGEAQAMGEGEFACAHTINSFSYVLCNFVKSFDVI